MASIATHLVKAGETLFSICNLYHITIDQLKKWNNIERNTIIPGQNLKVPTTETTKALVTEQPRSVLKKEIVQKTTQHKITSVEPANSDENQVPEVKKEENIKSLTYEVKKGESLFSIAKENNMSIDELKKMNKLDDNKIKPGQKLNLSTQSKNSEKNFAKEKFTHKVHSGESFYSIAKKYGCKIDDLKEWNNKSDNKVKIGDKLIIYSNN
jgi:membrane-bound lytic murein transglycosylase D